MTEALGEVINFGFFTQERKKLSEREGDNFNENVNYYKYMNYMK